MDNARKFLARVVPWPTADDNWWITIHRKWRNDEGRSGFDKGRAFKDLEDAIGWINWGRDLPGADTYVCMSGQGLVEEHYNKSGRRIYIPDRKVDNAIALRSIWLDVDLQSSHTTGTEAGFATREAMLAAVLAFLKVSGLPPPSVIVWTGNGVHLDWTFEDPLSVSQWLPLAEALVAATQHHGFAPLDTGLVTNAACILRVPDTRNWKTDPPKPVGLLRWGNIYSFARIQNVLAPFYGIKATKNQTPLVPGQSILGPAFPVKQPLPFDRRERYPELGFQGTIDDVAAVCPFIRATLDTAGEGLREPVWWESLKVAYYTKDPHDAALRLSTGYGEGAAADTADKLTHIEKDRLKRDLGWPRCSTIHAAGATQCAECPHLAKQLTPFHFVTGKAPSVQSEIVGGVDIQVNGHHGAAPPVDTDSIIVPKELLGKLPLGYRHDARGIVWMKVEVDPEKPGPDEVMVCPLPIYDVQKQRAREDGVGEYALTFETRLDRTNRPRIYLPYAHLDEPRLLWGTLNKAGMHFDQRYHPITKGLMSSFTQQLFASLEVATPAELLGWSEENGKRTAFVYANKRYSPDGTTTVGSPNQKIDQLYRPMGSLDVWKRAAKLITDQKIPATQALVAAGFGACLVPATGHTGLVLNAWSLATGISKSSACRVGQAVWAPPTKGMSKADDTHNALSDKFGAIRHLPGYFDDYQQKKDETRIVQLIFGMGQGRTKERMTRAIDRAPVHSFSTLLITTSNSRLSDFVAEHTAMTEAGVYRIFEFKVPENVTGAGMINVAEATQLIGSLDLNCGRAGEIVAEFYGKNAIRVDKEVHALYAGLCERFKVSMKERFWVAVITVIYMGARYGNQLDLTEIDEPELLKFLIDQLTVMRRDRNIRSQDYSKVDTILDKVSAYVNARRQQTVVTDRIWMQTGTPSFEIRPLCDMTRLQGRLAVRAVRDDKLLRLSKKDFIDWANKETIHGHGQMLARTLVEQFVAKEQRGTITAHVQTSVKGASQETLLDIDLNRYPQAYVFD